MGDISLVIGKYFVAQQASVHLEKGGTFDIVAQVNLHFVFVLTCYFVYKVYISLEWQCLFKIEILVEGSGIYFYLTQFLTDKLCF